MKAKLTGIKENMGYFFSIEDSNGDNVFEYVVFNSIIPLCISIIIQNKLDVSFELLEYKKTVLFYSNDQEVYCELNVKPGRCLSLIPLKEDVLNDFEKFLKFLDKITNKT